MGITAVLFFHPDFLFSRQLVVQLVSDIAKLKQQGILNEV